jgi:hypothetical protein
VGHLHGKIVSHLIELLLLPYEELNVCFCIYVQLKGGKRVGGFSARCHLLPPDVYLAGHFYLVC